MLAEKTERACEDDSKIKDGSYIMRTFGMICAKTLAVGAYTVEHIISVSVI